MARWPGAAVLVAILALAMPGAAYSAGLTRVSSTGIGGPVYGMTRSPDGVLHLVYETAPDGLDAGPRAHVAGVVDEGPRDQHVEGPEPAIAAMSLWREGSKP